MTNITPQFLWLLKQDPTSQPIIAIGNSHSLLLSSSKFFVNSVVQLELRKYNETPVDTTIANELFVENLDTPIIVVKYKHENQRYEYKHILYHNCVIRDKSLFLSKRDVQKYDSSNILLQD